MDPADTLPPVEQDQNNRNEKDEPLFLQELLAICCGVISPKSLNGLNHCNLDNDFQIANQEQNIGMLLRYQGFLGLNYVALSSKRCINYARLCSIIEFLCCMRYMIKTIPYSLYDIGST